MKTVPLVTVIEGLAVPLSVHGPFTSNGSAAAASAAGAAAAGPASVTADASAMPVSARAVRNLPRTALPVVLPILKGPPPRGSWLPRTRSVRVSTAIAIAAMLAVAILHLLLIAGVLDFDVQVLMAVAAFLPVYAWVFIVSSIGHRHGALSRSVTRFGLLLGASFPLGLLITAAGYLAGSASGHPLALASPGIVLGAWSWLALPVWPLILARLVFSKPPSFKADKEGLS